MALARIAERLQVRGKRHLIDVIGVDRRRNRDLGDVVVKAADEQRIAGGVVRQVQSAIREVVALRGVEAAESRPGM